MDLIALSNENRNRFAAELGEMHRLRARSFVKRLGWCLPALDGYEADELDQLPSVIHLLAVDKGRVLGALRLLPSTGPTLLSSYFPDDFRSLGQPNDPAIYECSRFCVESSRAIGSAPTRQVSSALLASLCRFCIASGIKQIVGIYQPQMRRIYRHLGWPPETAFQATGCNGFVGTWQPNTITLSRLEQRFAARAKTNTIPSNRAKIFEIQPNTPLDHGELFK
jgi:acyl homoserine lactone synthase